MIELLQFRFSPYNEKLRWALDHKRLPHRRTPLLPGPHLLRVKKLTGRTLTPVLLCDGVARDESAALLEWLETRQPQPALFPADPIQRAQALELAHHFDTDIGPRGRRAVLAALLQTPAYFARVFGDGHSRWAQLAYAATVPLAAPLVRKGNGISGAAAIADGLLAFEQGLDAVAAKSKPSGYLVGNTFTVADLTAASMLAMCVDPPSSSMTRPQPMAQPLAALIARYAQHPGAAWVREIYRRHRGSVGDFNGESIYP